MDKKKTAAKKRKQTRPLRKREGTTPVTPLLMADVQAKHGGVVPLGRAHGGVVPL